MRREWWYIFTSIENAARIFCDIHTHIIYIYINYEIYMHHISYITIYMYIYIYTQHYLERGGDRGYENKTEHFLVKVSANPEIKCCPFSWLFCSHKHRHFAIRVRMSYLNTHTHTHTPQVICWLPFGQQAIVWTNCEPFDFPSRFLIILNILFPIPPLCFPKHDTSFVRRFTLSMMFALNCL